MQFINSSLEKLVKNLSDNIKFRALKKKDADPYEYIDSFKRFSEEKLPDKK